MATHVPLAAARTRNAWLSAALVGAVLGGIVLGVGGRLAMRGIAIWQNGPRTWSVEGTITVVGLGIACGLIGGLARAAIARWLPRRLPAWTQPTLFAIVYTALGLRVLSPLDVPRLVLFLPVTAIYLLAVERGWRRIAARS